MNKYQIREKAYTEALAANRVGIRLTDNIIKSTPFNPYSVVEFVDNTVDNTVSKKHSDLDLEYFSRLSTLKERKNLEYKEKQFNRYYGK